MQKYFVFFDDDYADCGGKGLDEFEKEEEALNFIQERITHEGGRRIRTLTDYTLIYGKKMDLEGYETVTKVRITP